MAGIFGLAGINGSDYQFVNTIGQGIVYDVTRRYLDIYNQSMTDALALFVERETELFSERYKLPGGGRLQRRGNLTLPAATKAYGSWDVAYPLEDFGAQVATTDIAMAYMTPAEYERHVETVRIQDANTVRFEILKRLFKNTTDTFVDPDGKTANLTIQPLANGDAVTYPPVMGSETEAIEDHYLYSGYAATAINNTNNPYVTMRDDLLHHSGASTGGNNVVALINSAEEAETVALANFTEVEDRWIRAGSATDIPINLPGVPGRIIGRTDGVWVSVWDWIPATYQIAINLEEPAPLVMRVDPAATGLGRGLQLVATDQSFPLQSAIWRHRFGLGTGNRLNAVVMFLTTGASYTIPTAYQ